MFSKISRENAKKENISTQCTLYLDDDDTLAASTETKHLVEVSIFQTRRKFTTFVVCICNCKCHLPNWVYSSEKNISTRYFDKLFSKHFAKIFRQIIF